MRLRSVGIAYLLLCATWVACGAFAAEPSNPVVEEHAAFTDDEIEQAVDKLNADPNLAGERKTRTLRWKKDDEEKKPPPDASPEWIRWIADFFSWFGETARVVVWVAAALFVAILAVWIVRFVRGVDGRFAPTQGALAPTHVRDLDIRPESLPDDIGKAAQNLWDRGEHRSSLSLLYRGLLSRLAHRFGVPIRHSSTEGECRTLALEHLPAQCHAYVAALIGTWQGAVYGGINPTNERVRYLCTEFVTLDQAPVLQSPVASFAVTSMTNASPST